MKRIGIIGAGIMAAGMAKNFLAHGHEVTIWNRSQDRLQSILKAGALSADSPREVSALSDIVIECVSDDEASRSVWLGKQGILEGSDKNKVLITSSSLSLEWVDELTKLCKEKGFQFLDMPLTGSRAGAENGTLRLLVGGESDTLESIRGDLGSISEKIYHFGPTGSGMRFKLILNSLIGIHMNAVGQAMSLAKKAGIDPKAFANALIDGNMGPLSPSTKLVLDSENWEDGRVNFAIELLEKDLRYAIKMTNKYSFTFDLLETTQADFKIAKDNGLGKFDVTSIKKQFE